VKAFGVYFPSIVVGLIAATAYADVELTSEQRENLGIRTESVGTVKVARSWAASAQVLDISTLVTSLGELRAAEQAAIASRDEADRSERLYQNDRNVARKVVDAARLQRITDEGRVRTARAQLVASWGTGISALPASARERLVDDLLEGRAVLVRAEQIMPLPAGTSVKRARVSTLNGTQSWDAERLGPFPQATAPTMGGASLLRVPTALPVGALLRAALLDDRAASDRSTVPPSALIRWRGAEWVYEERSENHFARREVHAGAEVAGHVAIDAGDGALQNVVSVGARALLAAELGAAEPAADAGEEN
jgi:hypothetical protein